MSLSLVQLKTLFRQKIKVLAGGPADKTRGAALIASLDALAEAATSGTTTINVNSLTDATPAGRALLKAADAPAQLRLLDKLVIAATATHPAFTQAYGAGGAIAWLLSVVGNLAAVPDKPAAPTNGHADDSADIFYGTINPVFTALGDYEIYYPGSLGNVPATNGRADLVGTTLTIRGLTGNNAAGTVGMRVAGSGNRPASDWLTNTDAFTGTTAPSGDTTAPVISITVPTAGAVLVAGTAVTLTAQATDNVAVSGVSFTNGGTGAVLGAGVKNGNTYTYSYTPTTAGPLTITATAVDAAGNSQAASVSITVQAVANSIPVANAGTDPAITLPTNQVVLQGSGTDADPGDTLTYAWRQVAGAAVSGMPSTVQQPVVTFTTAGTYQFGLVVTDSHGAPSPEDFVVVTVNAATSAKTQLVFDGDSRTAGTNGQTPYPTLLQANLGTTAYGDYGNIAVSGSGSGAQLARLPNTLNPRRNTSLYPVAVYTFMIGINDWGAGGTSAGDTVPSTTSIIQDAVTNGFRPIIGTVPPVGQQYGSAYTPSQLEAQRLAYNAQVRANWKAWGCRGLVDYAADSRLADPHNHTYFDNFDGLELHFTTAGNQVMADLAAPAIAAVAAGNFYGVVTPIPAPTPQPASGNLRQFQASSATVNGSNQVLTIPDTLTSDVLTVDSSYNGGALATRISLNSLPAIQFDTNRMVGSVPLGLSGTAPRTLLMAVWLDNGLLSELAGSRPGALGAGTIADLDIYDGGVILHTAGTNGIGSTNPQPVIPTGTCIIGFHVGTDGVGRVIVNDLGNLQNATNVNTSDGPFSLGLGAHALAEGGRFKFYEAIWRADDNATAMATNVAYLKAKYNITY